jgi:hypothetical protein
LVHRNLLRFRPYLRYVRPQQTKCGVICKAVHFATKHSWGLTCCGLSTMTVSLSLVIDVYASDRERGEGFRNFRNEPRTWRTNYFSTSITQTKRARWLQPTSSIGDFDNGQF